MPHTAPATVHRSALHELLHVVVRRASHRGVSAFFAGVALVIAALAVLVVAWRAPAALGGPAAAAVVAALLRGRVARGDDREARDTGGARPPEATAAAPAAPCATGTAPRPAAQLRAHVTWHVRRPACAARRDDA